MSKDYKSQLKGVNGANFKEFWASLPEKQANCIRVFRMDSMGHFTVHGDDTRHMVEILQNENCIVKARTEANTTNMPWAMINLIQVRRLLRELVFIQGYRVEIYERAENDPEEWEVNYGSPGNLSCVEHLVFDPTGDSYVPSTKIMGLKLLKGDRFSLAIVNAEDREVQVATFNDDPRLTDLESVFIQSQVREVLVTASNDKLARVAERCSVMITKVSKATFDAPSADACKTLFAKGSMIEDADQIGCFHAAVQFLKIETGIGLFKVFPMNMANTMRLDSSIFENLHLCSDTEKSLFSILAMHCATPHGVRRVRQWITQPLMLEQSILERQNIVAALIENGDIRERLSSVALKGLPDIARIAFKLKQLDSGKAINYKLALRSFCRIHDLCKRVPTIMETLKETDDPIFEPILSPLGIVDGKIQKLILLFESHIDMTRNLAIKRGIDNDLDEQVEKAEEVVERMAELVSDAADALDLPVSDVKLDDAPVTIGGKVFRVTNKNDKAVLAAEKRGKFRRVSTTKGAITFTSNPLQLLSDEFNEFNIHVQNITREIVTKMLGIVLGYTKYLLQIGDITSSLDALLALSHAALASSEPWTKPIFSDKKEIEIEELRHPILESQLVECVPNDVKMSDDRRLMILTGPNMGGKSTFLRSVGLCSLLAQIGSFVPAASAQIPIVDTIIARIGAGDNLQRGISTFQHEMIETETIFRCASERSLLLIDELGRGTSTWDGFGLAYAISEHIATKIRSLTFFATHYHEMASLASRCKGVFNMHTSVFVRDEKITHLYKVSDGPCAQSYGIEIAKLAGFDHGVIKRANELNEEKAEVEMALATAQLDDENWRRSVEVMEEMAQKKNADVEDAMIVEYADSKQNVLIEACTNALPASKMKKLSI